MSKRKLLLADDSITIQKVVNLTFAEEGIDVVTVGDGDTALARIGEEWPDLIMADVNMPGASGYQVCEAVKSDRATRDIPVVLLVGSFEPFDPAEAERVGADAYLTKPFQSIRQLVSQVADLINERQRMLAESAREDELSETAVAAQEGEDSVEVESLYHESLSNHPRPEMPLDDELGDQGLDDEMIETSFVAGEEAEEMLEFGIETPEPALPQPAIATPAPAANEADTPFAGLALPAAPQYQQATASAPEPAAVRHEIAEEPFEDLRSISEAPTEEFSFWEQTSETGLAPAGQPTPAPAAAQSAPSVSASPAVHAATVPVYQPPVSENVSLNIEEIDLLELPPAAEGGTIEFTSPENAVVDDRLRQVVSISPELMEIIVQRVVERLASKHD